MDKFTNCGDDTEFETTNFESFDTDTPNYDGVRLMDVQDYRYNTEPYNPDQYNGEVPYSQDQYNQEQYNPEQYNSELSYNQEQYMAPTYNSETYNVAEFPFEQYSEEQIDEQPATEDDSIFSPLYPEGYAPAQNPNDVFRATPTATPYDENNLTEAELADIRRQKAAARRKKQAARERRRRERRKQAIIRCSILLAIIIFLIVGLIMLISGIANHFKEKKKARELSEFYATSELTTEEPVAKIDPEITAKALPADRDSALAKLQEQATDDSTMQSICDSAAAIPDILLQYLAVNPEMKEFTLSYPAMINIVFDGEFSVDLENNSVPLYLQFDKRWGYADYSEDIIGLRGAGPTALSMAYTYLMKDGSKNPIKVADYATASGYLDENGKTHWSLMIDGAKGLGLESSEMKIKKDDMIDALEEGNLLICMVSSGDFSTDDHFIVIRDYKKGLFYINDPMSKERSDVGWDFKRLRGQITKMCVLSPGETTPSTQEGTTGESTSENTTTEAETPDEQ